MANTHFLGPVISTNGFQGATAGVVTATALQIPTSTTTLLGDKTGAVNTINKVAGTTVYNTTAKVFYVAQGSTATSTWISAADGTTTITPA